MLVFGSNSVAASVDTRVLVPGYSRSTAAVLGGEAGGGSEGAYRVTRAGTIRNLRVRHNANNGNGNPVVYTLYRNGAPTLLTASLATAALGDASDLVNAVAVAAGDLIQMIASKALALGSGVVVCQVVVQFD